MKDCFSLAHVLLALDLICICRATSSSYECNTIDGGICSEAVSEADVSAVDDVDAMDVRVSLMQKGVAHLQQSLNSMREKRIGYPFDGLQCPGEMVMKTLQMTVDDYDAVVASMRQLYDSQSPSCNATHCDQSHWAGCVLRLAAHDFMDYSGDSERACGGSDGCWIASDPDNAGLSDCFAGGPHVVGLAHVYQDFCNKISFADFIVIAAEGVMNITRENVLNSHPDRQALDFRSRFKFGRETKAECAYSFVKLPDAEEGCTAVNDSLVTRLGLTWDQSAALMGAHTIGGANPSNSGYRGRWTEARASRLFDNSYYTSLMLKGWAPERAISGNVNKNAWRRSDIGADEIGKGKEMMLDSDMCLYHSFYDHYSDPNAFHARTAVNQRCSCAWVDAKDNYNAIYMYNYGEFCGSTEFFANFSTELNDFGLEFGEGAGHLGLAGEVTLNFTKQRNLCCGISAFEEKQRIVEPSSDCGLPNAPKGTAALAVHSFANDEDEWIRVYYEAWAIATTKGREASLLDLSIHR
jgi:hypothetical protein